MNPEWLVLFTSPKHLFRFFSDVLALGLIMLIDGWFLVRLSREHGVYLALALEGIVAIVAVVIVGSSISKQIRHLRNEARDGAYRPSGYAELATLVVSATLMVLPGFASDAIGALLYLPPGRQVCRAIFARRHRTRLPVVYEYLKLSVFSSDDGEPDGESAAPER